MLLGPWKAVPIKGLGNNLQPEPISSAKAHSYSCNICKESKYSEVGPARYICMGCRADPNFKGDFSDICEKCLEKLIIKDEEALKMMRPDGHAENHPFLRILYSTKGYYDW